MTTKHKPAAMGTSEAMINQCVEAFEGKRFSTGRRYDLIAPEFIEGMAIIMSVGAEKYGELNWQKGLPGHKNGITHALGHLNDFQQNKPNEYSEGTPYGNELHLAQAGVNCMFEFWFRCNERRKKEAAMIDQAMRERDNLDRIIKRK